MKEKLMINITDKDMDEIIAIQFGDDIYFGKTAVDKAIYLQDFQKIYSRAIFKFLFEIDLNPKWAEYAEYPTLFTLSEYNNFCNLPAGKPIC